MADVGMAKESDNGPRRSSGFARLLGDRAPKTSEPDANAVVLAHVISAPDMAPEATQIDNNLKAISRSRDSSEQDESE